MAARCKAAWTRALKLGAAALALAGLLALINPGDIDYWLPVLPALSMRAVLAFFAAFAIANFIAFIYAGLYYPMAFGAVGTGALALFLLWLAEGAVLMLPYYLLGAAMRPLNGMNGF